MNLAVNKMDYAVNNYQSNEVKVGYVRLSRDENKENYTSIENQKKIIETYAKEKGWVIDRFYEDDGYSGYSFDRPDFNVLLNDLESNKIDIVIAKDLSRIGRHNAHTLLFLENLKAMGKRIILINDNYDSDNDEDDTIGIKTWVNERYVKDNSKKIKSVIKSKQKEGKFVCAVPYGYKVHPHIKHKIVVDKECAMYVQKIFDMYVNGDGYRKIASTLTEMGVPTPSMMEAKRKEEQRLVYNKDVTNEWSSSMVMRLIRNDFYIGILRQGKNQLKGINGKNMKTPKEQHHVFENNHEAIISHDLYNLAQQLSEKRKINDYRGQPIHKNLYSGFLYCSDCGEKMVALNKEGKNKSYICGTYNRRGKKYCSTHYVLDSKLTKAIKNYLYRCREGLKDVLLTYDKSVEEAIKTKENYSSVVRKLEQDLLIAKDELKALMSQKIKEIAKNPSMQDIINETYDELQREKMERIQILQNQVADFKEISQKTQNMKRSLKTALDVFNDIIEKDEIEKKDLELVVDKIIVSQDGDLEIRLKNSLGVLAENVPSEIEQPDPLLVKGFELILDCGQDRISRQGLKTGLRIGERKTTYVMDSLIKLGLISPQPIENDRYKRHAILVQRVTPDEEAMILEKLKNKNNKTIVAGEPGSYAIQGIGSLIVEKIDGCYFNVVGLPVLRLSAILKEFGVDLLKQRG